MSYYDYIYWLSISREDRGMLSSEQCRLLALYICKIDKRR